MWNHSFIEPKYDGLSPSAVISNDLCDICGEGKKVHQWIGSNVQKASDHFDVIDDDSSIIQNKECGICMGEYENSISLPQCNHMFCLECCIGYIVNQITYNLIESITCPKANCNKEINKEFFMHLLPEEVKVKYNRFQSMNQIAKNPHYIFCPLCDSYSILDNQVSLTSTNDKVLIQCLNGHSFCSCGRPEHNGNCYKEADDFNQFLHNEKINKCPKCGFLIKKDNGCNHMTCANPLCKYEFCWLCMKEYSIDHYRTEEECFHLEFIDPNGLLFKIRKHHLLFTILAFLSSIFNWSFVVMRILATIIFPIPFVAIPIYNYYIRGGHRLITTVINISNVKPKTLDGIVWFCMTVLSFTLLPLYYLCLFLAMGIICLILSFYHYGLMIIVIYYLIKTFKMRLELKSQEF